MRLLHISDFNGERNKKTSVFIRIYVFIYTYTILSGHISVSLPGYLLINREGELFQLHYGLIEPYCSDLAVHQGGGN